MQINYTYDQATSSLPAGMVTALNYVAAYFGTLFKANITVNIEIGYGEITQNGVSTPVSGGAVGGPNSITTVPFSQLATDLAATGTSPAERALLAHLGASDPSGGLGIQLSSAQRKAMGLLSANNPIIDGSVGFQTDGANGVNYNFSTTLAGRNNGSGWDFVGVAMHEIAHALGRVSGSGSDYGLFDLTRYASAGVFGRDGGSDYFSLDGGVTDLHNYDVSSDPADWASGQGVDAFNATTGYQANPLSGVDRTLMNALGMNTTSAARDFFGNRVSSVLWFNSSSGTVLDWKMANGAFSSSTTIAGFTPNSGWSVAGTADLSGNGVSDVLLNYTAGGQTTIGAWIVSNGAYSSYSALGGFATNSGWAVVGRGDFDGDGVTDILLSYTSGGNVSLSDWRISGGAIASTQNLNMGYSTASGWSVIGTGDFNGDGFSDVLFQNTTTGAVADWLVSPTSGMAGTFNAIAGITPNSGWTFDGVGDFNGDGTSDLLWSNGARLAIWDVANGALSQTFNIDASSAVNAGYSFAGIGDYNGDGTSDILWRNTSTGNAQVWTISNNALLQAIGTGGADASSWHIVA